MKAKIASLSLIQSASLDNHRQLTGCLPCFGTVVDRIVHQELSCGSIIFVLKKIKVWLDKKASSWRTAFYNELCQY